MLYMFGKDPWLGETKRERASVTGQNHFKNLLFYVFKGHLCCVTNFWPF